MKVKGYLLLGIRSILVLVLLAVMISTQLAEKNSNASIETVAERVVSVLGSSDHMERSTNRMFKKFYGLTAGDYEGVVFYKPVSGMDAEELVIIKLKNNAQAEEAAAAIEQRLASQKTSFEGYGIEQTALLKDAVLDVRGNYILYVVHKDAASADHVFRDSL